MTFFALYTEGPSILKIGYFYKLKTLATLCLQGFLNIHKNQKN
jgi:hypothetical protein